MPPKIAKAGLLVVAAAASALFACAQPPVDAPAPGAPPFETPGPPSAAPPAIAALGDPCAPLVAKFARALAAAPGSCRSDRDCACYPGGIGEASGCGGVTDAFTAGALGAIASDYRAAGCTYTVQCAPWACEPRCVDGKCSR